MIELIKFDINFFRIALNSCGYSVCSDFINSSLAVINLLPFLMVAFMKKISAMTNIISIISIIASSK